jgi:hypothetical protein
MSFAAVAVVTDSCLKCGLYQGCREKFFEMSVAAITVVTESCLKYGL